MFRKKGAPKRPEVPTRAFAFGAKEPTENLDVVRESLWRAHRYRNNLVQVELERRAAVNALLVRLCPDVGALTDTVTQENDAVKAAAAAIKQRNAAEQRKRATPAESTHLRALRATLKTHRAQLKEARTVAFASTTLRADLEAIDAAARARRRELRAVCGLYWGTYVAVEDGLKNIHKGRPPKYHQWRGEGKLAVQFQHGLTVGQLCAGHDRRGRVAFPPSARTHTPLATARLRIGSVEKRRPLWTTVPFYYSEDMPTDGVVKLAYLVCRRIGTHSDWSVSFTVERAAGFPKPAGAASGRVGIDLGWRLLPDGNLRVAYWVGSDGREGQLLLPAEQLTGWTKVEELQAIRDRLFNGARDTLAAWLSGAACPSWPADQAAWLRSAEAGWTRRADDLANDTSTRGRREALRLRAEAKRAQTEAAAMRRLLVHWRDERGDSAWLRTAAEHLGQWRSPNRLASVVLRWRDQRFPGDAAIVAVLEAWRRQDKHLYDWGAEQYRRMRRWRDDWYHNFVAGLRAHYQTAVVEDAVWAHLQRRPQAEDNEPDRGSRIYRRIAVPGRLREIVEAGMPAKERRPTAMTTQRCCDCLRIDAFDAAAELIRTCQHCGKTRDQDQRAALNLLLTEGDCTKKNKERRRC